MTLSKKKSRPITVDDVVYRYQFSTTAINESGNFKLNLTIEQENIKGSVLQVEGLLTRDYWLDSSDHKKSNRSDYPVIMPKHISKIITIAMLDGWQPSSQGSTYKLSIDGSAIISG